MANQRYHRWKSQLPLIAVLLSLLLLILVPVLVQRRMMGLRRELITEVNPARVLADDLQLQLAREAAATRGYLYTGERRYAEAHLRARALRNQAYARLHALAPRVGPEVEREVALLGEQLQPADTLLDAFYSGRLSNAEYQRYFPDQQRRFRDVTATAARLQEAIDAVARQHQAAISATEYQGAVLTVLLALLALIAVLMVARLASQYQQLAKRLERRARQEQELTEVARRLNASVTVQDVMQNTVDRAFSMSRAYGAYIERAASGGPDGAVEVSAVAGLGTPEVGTRIPYPGSLSEKIIESQEPEVMTEVGAIGERMAPYLESCCRLCSGLVVPLFSENRVLGGLVLLRGPEQPQFTPEEAAYVRILGDIASAAPRRVVLLEELRDSELKFRQMAEHLRDIIWLSAPDLSEFYYVNPSYERVFGRPVEEFYNSPQLFYDAVHPEDLERVKAARAAVLSRGYDIQYRIIRPNGEVRWLWSRAYPIYDEQGNVYRIAGIAEDITELKRAERERERRLALERDTHEKIAMILESITDAFYALDHDWRFTYMNREAERLLQTARDDAIGKVLWDLFPDIRNSTFDREYRYAMEQQETVQFEAYYEPLDIWIDVRVYPSAEGLSVFFRDVTDRMRIAAEREDLLEGEREARVESERRREELHRVTESRARLMRGFSHDLKNPLGAADGYLQLLEEGIVDSLTEKQRQSIGRVRASIRTALDLIADLLALERAEAGKLKVNRELLDVCKTAKEAAEEYRAQAAAKDLELAVECSENLPAIESDPLRIHQVIGNLLSNAVKYTARGRIDLIVAERDEVRRIPPAAPARAERGMPAPGRWIVVSVQDTGPGISREEQKVVFEEFRRLKTAGKEPGAGIGLAMSRTIARALHGDITVESKPGEGSKFTLWLPIERSAREQQPERWAAD